MGRMTRPMQALAMMQAFGWTYEEFLAQPQHLVTLYFEKLDRDRKKERLAANRANRGH